MNKAYYKYFKVYKLYMQLVIFASYIYIRFTNNKEKNLSGAKLE